MNGQTARQFFAPLIGLVLLFAALGPPVGGALFVPLAVLLKPPVAADALALSALIAALLGHTVMLVAAYAVGVGPAAATGFLFALCDAVAPERWPRSLVAAAIGGAAAYAAVLRFAALGASLEFTNSRQCRRFDRRLDQRGVFRRDRGRAGARLRRQRRHCRPRLGHGREPRRPEDAAGRGGRRTLGSRLMADAPRRLVSAEKRPEDDAALRPQALADFTGQEAARKNLKIFIESAKARGEALDHVLFVGPPGLGKTTLAQIVARELGVNFRSTSGPVIAKAGDLAAQLTNLEPRDVLFIDEIHRLNPAVEEILYPAMEDFQLDLIIGAGPAARSVKIDLAKFTLIGATTRAGLLTTPLRDRFGIPVRLNFYTTEELQSIVARGARVIGLALAEEGANEIAKRSRGTPRIAGRLLRRVRDFAVVEGARLVTRALADSALRLLDVDPIGLDQMDRRYLDAIAIKFGGGPVGVETIAAALSEPRDAIEDIIEPYLIQQGFVQRTPRGRLLTSHAFRHLGLAEPQREGPQPTLFEDE